MFDFLRKTQLWDALDAGALDEINGDKHFNLITAQSAVMYHLLRNVTESRVAEIGGGNGLDILSRLAYYNDCTYIDKLDGLYGGSKTAVVRNGIINVQARIGEFDLQLDESLFNVIFSISIIEHIKLEHLHDFFKDCARILRPGGTMLHMFDFYLPDVCSDSEVERFNLYRQLAAQLDNLEPIGTLLEAPPKLSATIVTNPDHVMYSYGKFSKTMIPFRQKAQATSLILGLRKTR